MDAPQADRAQLYDTLLKGALRGLDRAFDPLFPVMRHAVGLLEFLEAQNQLVVTRRSLVFGLLAYGFEPDETRGRPGNAANWLTGWVYESRPDFPRPGREEADTAAMASALDRGARVVFDSEVEDALVFAQSFAREVLRTEAAQVTERHLVAVLLAPDLKGGLLARVGLDVGQPFGEVGLDQARAAFTQWTDSWRPEEEDAELWRWTFRDAMALPGSAPATDGPGPVLTPPAAPLVATFAPDRPAADLDGPDPLKVDKDVIAFARLIAHQGMATPLAIGVFGPWGSGKSTFMEKLEKHIDRLAAPDRPNAGRDGFVSSVVHVRFNAWSFADANLWASLGAEFFDQLRVGGHSKKGSHLHANLVERVTTHVHDLRSTAEATRAVAHEGERELAAAQKLRDKAVKTARQGEAPALPQALLDGLSRAHEAFAAEFGHKPGELGALIKTVRDVQTGVGRGLTAAKLITRGGWRTIAPVALFGAGLAGALALRVFAPGLLKAAGEQWLTLLAGPGVLALGASFTSGLKLAKTFAKETAGFAEQLQKGDEDRVAKVLAAELALKDAATEADARRKAAERAARALSRYIDPQGTSNPPRLLRYVLEDDPATRALEKEIGLISRTRRLFEAVDEILREDRKARRDGAPVDKDTPERIVLYIDDLDRCTHEQVQSVLQAVHLLLAFEAFVVVVGVDQTRVAEVLARQFDDDDDPDNDDEDEVARRMDRAVLYLEKIFQLAFRLRPLSPAGSDGGAYGRFVMHLTSRSTARHGPPGVSAPAPRTARTPPPPADTPTTGEPDLDPPKSVTPTPPPDASAETPAETRPDAEEMREALATLILDGEEAQFLASVAIGTVAGSTPRNVKRMLNVYRLARVRLAEDGFDLLGANGPPVYPLLALFAAMDTGRKRRAAKQVFDALKVDGTPLEAIVRLALPPAEATMVTDAIEAAFGAMPTAKDCRPIAELVRRYSFNALDD